jgi:hypothetical protein
MNMRIIVDGGDVGMVDDHGVFAPGANGIRISPITERLIQRLLDGQGYGDVLFQLERDGVTYEGCTLDGSAEITFLRS